MKNIEELKESLEIVYEYLKDNNLGDYGKGVLSELENAQRIVENLSLCDVVKSLPKNNDFINMLIEEVNCSGEQEGIYFSEALRYGEGAKQKIKEFEKMIEDYQR